MNRLVLVFCCVGYTACVGELPLARSMRQIGNDRDVQTAARRANIDYKKALDHALARDPNGLRELFRYTTSGWFDGEAGELHSEILWDLLNYWGDRAFAAVLAQETPRVQRAVVNELETHPKFNRSTYPMTHQIVGADYRGSHQLIHSPLPVAHD